MNKFQYNKKNIIKALVEAGLEKGNTAYFSTSLGMIGVAEDVKIQDDLNFLFFGAIKKVIGPVGTILIPTYSYTIGKSTRSNPVIFDPLITPAKIGPFPDFFLKQQGVIRSLDPMVSIAGLGPKVQGLFEDLPPTSYGAGSLYNRLVDHPNTKCVSIGLGPNWIPFIHYADWLSQVPHRYDKLFYGGIKKPSGDVEYTYWVYSVRAMIAESWADAHELGKKATEAGIWSYAPLGRARVYVCDYKEYFDFTMNLMQDDKWLMAKGPACNVLKKDQERMKKTIPVEPADREMTGKELIQYFYDFPRDTIDEGIDFCLSYLKKHFPIDIQKFKTGMNVFDWIVPERTQKQNGKDVFSMGELKTGEWLLKGESEDSILLCCYLDGHANHKLSGLAVALEAMKKLKENSDRKITYRLAILSGTAGYAAYLSTLDNINVIGAIHLTTVGTKLPFTLQRSETGNKEFETIIQQTLVEKYNNHHFLPSKALCDIVAPGHNPVATEKLSDLPFDNIVLARVHNKGHEDFPFKEYQTNKDNIDIIDIKALEESVDCLFEILFKWADKKVYRTDMIVSNEKIGA
jgi:aminoglycoside N3'-acetyltransferase